MAGCAGAAELGRESAAPNGRLTQSRQARKERLERAVLARQNLETLLPEIEKHKKLGRHRPRVIVFTGIEGLRTAFEATLESHEKLMRIASSAGKIARSLPEYLPRYMRERFRRGIRMIGIHPADEMGRLMVEHSPKGFDEYTLLPEDRFAFPSDLGIFDDKLAFMSHEPPLSVAIECKAMADNMKTLFDLAREEALRIGYDPHARHG